MVKQHPDTSRVLTTKLGFTLIELMVVITVIAIIAATSFFGLKNYKANQDVLNAQKEFISNLRAVQNDQNSGGASSNITDVYVDTISDFYRIGSGAIISSPGTELQVSASSVYFSYTHFCFTNPALTGYDKNNQCVMCAYTTSNYFACRGGDSTASTIIPEQQIRVDFVKTGATTRSVYIEGSGMTITSIHE